MLYDKYLPNLFIWKCIIFALLLFFTSCDEPTQPENKAPLIKNILSSDAPFYKNQIVDISAVVEDENKKSLTYFWKVSAGSLLTNTSESVQLKLPNEPKNINIYLTVTDDQGQTSRQSERINMDNGALLEGYCYYSKTKIPIENVLIKLDYLETNTNQDGYFKIENCIEGNDLNLNVFKKEFTSLDTTIEIKNNSQNRIDFYLYSNTKTYDVSGYIRTGDEEAISNVKVQLYNPDNTPSNIFTTSNSSGWYSLNNIPTGNYIFKTSESINDVDVESDLNINIPDYDIQYDIRAYKYKIIIEEDYPQPDSAGQYWYHYDFPVDCFNVNVFYETESSGLLRCDFYINGYYSGYWYYHNLVKIYNLTSVELKEAILGNSVDMWLTGYYSITVKKFRLSYYY